MKVNTPASSAWAAGVGVSVEQSADLYQLIFDRHRTSCLVITSNWAVVVEGLGLFAAYLGNSAFCRKLGLP